MQTVDWLWLIHPALAVVVVYPLLGMVLRLAQQTRDRRVLHSKLPPTVGRDHADLGQWLTAAVVGVVLIAETVVIATSKRLISMGERDAWCNCCLCGSAVSSPSLRSGVCGSRPTAPASPCSPGSG